MPSRLPSNVASTRSLSAALPGEEGAGATDAVGCDTTAALELEEGLMDTYEYQTGMVPISARSHET